jgi:DNA repair ATPase RecN
VARMLGGVTITANTLAHAQEMLESARTGDVG